MLVGTCQFAGWEDSRGSLVCCKGRGSALPGLGIPSSCSHGRAGVSIPIRKAAQAFCACLTQDSDPSQSCQSGERPFLPGRTSPVIEVSVPAELMEKMGRGAGVSQSASTSAFCSTSPAQVNIPVFPGTAEPFPASFFSQKFSAGHVLSIRSISSMYVWFCFCLLAKPGNYNYY